MKSGTQKHFSEQYATMFLAELINLLEKKGQEYGKDHAHENFISGERTLGIPKRLYLLSLAFKHFDALIKYSKGRELKQTKVRERVMDIIIYLLLFAYMDRLDEDKSPF